MPYVNISEGRDFERSVRLFSKRVLEDGILSQVKRRANGAMSRTERRRLKDRLAIRRRLRSEKRNKHE